MGRIFMFLCLANFYYVWDIVDYNVMEIQDSVIFFWRVLTLVLEGSSITGRSLWKPTKVWVYSFVGRIYVRVGQSRHFSGSRSPLWRFSLSVFSAKYEDWWQSINKLATLLWPESTQFLDSFKNLTSATVALWCFWKVSIYIYLDQPCKVFTNDLLGTILCIGPLSLIPSTGPLFFT